jgi:hypothetical protein
MATRSRYDELHDKYNALLTTKQGTRYERLAAIVFKVLEENDVVIHDVKLVGTSDVPHQIDVHIERDGRARRVIIECKDFDISSQKIGLDVVRNFWAVAEDTRADEALILTCTGFTADAAKFAKAKGIKLAVLRIFEDADWEGRIRTINLTIIALSRVDYSMSINVANEDAKREIASATASLSLPNGVSAIDPVYAVRGDQSTQFLKFVEAGIDDKTRHTPLNSTPDKVTLRINSDGWKLKIRDYSPIAFDSIDVSYAVQRHESKISVTSKRIAELLVSGLVDSDIIIFDDQLTRLKIDPATGEVN